MFLHITGTNFRQHGHSVVFFWVNTQKGTVIILTVVIFYLSTSTLSGTN